MYTTAGCPCLPLSNTNSFNLNYCCRREQDTKQNPAHAFFSSYLIKNMVHSLCYISHFYIRWCSWNISRSQQVSTTIWKMPICKDGYKGFINIYDQFNNAVIHYFGWQNSKLKGIFTSASQSCCLFLFFFKKGSILEEFRSKEKESFLRKKKSLNFPAVTTYLHQLRNN